MFEWYTNFKHPTNDVNKQIFNSPGLVQAFHMREEIYIVLYELNDNYVHGWGIEVGNNGKIMHS
jgi:hypothetical protein